MALAHSIAKNTISHVSGRLAGVIIGVLTIGLLTRYLGQSGFGQYATILAFIQLATVIADLGLYMVTLRMLTESDNNESTTFNNILSLRIVSGALLVLVASSIVWLFPYPTVVKLGIIIYAIVAWIALIDQIFVAGLQKHLSVTRVAIAEVVNKIVILAFVIAATIYKLDILFIFAGHIVAIVIHALLNLAKIKQFIHVKLGFDKKIWKKILALSLPIAVSSIFTMIYFKADTLFLSLFRSEEEVGIYAAPYRALEVLISFAPLFMGLVMPVLTKAKDNKEEFKNVFQKTYNALIIIAFLLVAVTIPLAEPIIILIAGSEFVVSTGVLQILIIATAIIYLAHLTTYSIIAIGKQKVMIKYYVTAAFLAVVGYITLIPLYTYWAAAWVTLGVELFILIASYIMVKREENISLEHQTTVKTLTSGLITGATLFIIKDTSIFITLPLGILIYIGLLLITKTINKEEITKLIHKG